MSVTDASKADDELGVTSAAPIPLNQTNEQGTLHEDVNPAVVSLSMFITKATTNDLGVRRWASTASDDLQDSYGTRMSLDLFKGFIDRIEQGVPAPEQLRSKAWDGVIPYLSVAHYKDLNGFGIVGPATRVVIDGNRLKAQGVFDNPKNPSLVDAAYTTVRSDIENKVPDEQRVRISIGFLDLKHAHGQSVFVRKSLDDICPVCSQGTLPDVYLDGQIIHFALTRIPVNKRTDFVAWEERAHNMTTRVEDAASIVGEEEAKKLEELARESVVRSEALVEVSEADTEAVMVKSDMDAYYGGA